MKAVKYKGQVFTVPNYAKFIAADDNGEVWAYERMPEANSRGYSEPSYDGRVSRVGSLDGATENKPLFHVKEIK